MRALLAVTAAAALAACTPQGQSAETTQAGMEAEAAAARTAIEAINAEWVAHFDAGHIDSLGKYYTENAVSMPPAKPAVIGRAAIVADMKSEPPPPGMTQKLVLNVANVVASGPIALERGTYIYSLTPTAGGVGIAINGKYLTHWHQVDGQWLIAEQIWNDDAPMTPPPAEPKRKT